MGASTFIGNIEAAVVGGATFDIQPPAGQAYCITEFSGDPVFVGDQADISFALRDGVHADAAVIIDPTTAPQKGQRAKELYITNVIYLAVTNEAVGANNVGWCGYRVSPEIVITDIITIPASARNDIRPPAGQVWKITEIGAETMGAANHPNMTFFLTDGTLILSAIMDQTHNLKQQKLLNWYISHDIWIQVLDLSAGDNDLGFSGILVEVEHVGDVVDVVGSATLDIQPPDGEQWVITEISVETWAGAAPAGSGDVLVSFYDGAVLSDIIEPGTVSDSLINNHAMALMIDRAHYIRVTEISTANNEVGYIGYVYREYEP